MAANGIDELDFRILRALQANARAAYREIAQALAVSPATVHERVRKLAGRGILTGYHARVDARAVGLPVTAFVGLVTAQGTDAYRTVEELQAIPEVEEVHVVTGRIDILVKVRARSNEHLQALLFDKIDRVYGFVRSETMVVLSSVEKAGPDLASLGPADPPHDRER